MVNGVDENRESEIFDKFSLIGGFSFIRTKIDIIGK